MLTQSYYETVSCSETHVPDVEKCPYTILLVSSRESSAAESQRAVCLIEMLKSIDVGGKEEQQIMSATRTHVHRTHPHARVLSHV